jgi:peroxiredoxin
MAGAPRVLVALFAWALLAAPVSAQPLPVGRLEIGAHAPGFTLSGADGRPHALSDYAGRIVVLEWTSPVCPYTAMKYRSGAVQTLQRRALKAGAAWLAIDTAAPGRPGHLTPVAATARIHRLHARVSAFLFDEDGAVGRLYGAKVTPSFFVIGRDGDLAYQGDLDPEPGDVAAPARNDLKAALDALAAGRPVRLAETRPYGCAVEY